ncbi:hypothetical protein M8J77_013933 [Diaphorina citri]|nr:hypothetical protein M8J77_013933 [Diaphorina citri]
MNECEVYECECPGAGTNTNRRPFWIPTLTKEPPILKQSFCGFVCYVCCLLPLILSTDTADRFQGAAHSETGLLWICLHACCLLPLILSIQTQETGSMEPPILVQTQQRGSMEPPILGTVAPWRSSISRLLRQGGKTPRSYSFSSKQFTNRPGNHTGRNM